MGSLRFRASLGLSAASIAALVAGGAFAAEQASTVEEIVVTAQKREESLQDVPIAISAYDGEIIEKANVDSVSELQYLAPSIYFGRQDAQALISIRGIGSSILSPGADAGIALHLDGVYLSKQQTHDAALFDVERVEVLRGPQGTVNGRNATGGSINVISRKPSEEPEGYLSVTAGNYSSIQTAGAVGGPIVPGRLMGRLAFRTDNREGYTPNIVSTTGEHKDEANQQSLRGSLLFRLSGAADLLLSADYDRVDTNGFATIIHRTVNGNPLPGAALGGVFVPSGRAIANNTPGSYRRETVGATATLTADTQLGTVTSITGYRRLSDRSISDVDGTSVSFLNQDSRIPHWQVSQEVNLASNSDGPLSWLVGAYYFREKQRPDQTFPTPTLGVVSTFGGIATTDSYAVYGQASYEVSERLTVTAGVRYTRDEKDASEYIKVAPINFVRTAELSDDWSAVTPKLSVDFDLTPEVMLYATVGRGFRSGGINVGNLQGSTFDPEFVWNYEAGMKGIFWDGRARLNVAAFHSKYSDLQLFQTRFQVATVENAAKATINGVEVELAANPTDSLQIDFAGSYLDATFDEFVTIDQARAALGPLDLAGNTLPRAPKGKINIGVEHSWSLPTGELTLRGEYSWTTRVYFNEFNRPETSQPEVSVVNLRASFATPDERYRIAAFVENATDEYYISNTTVGSARTAFAILEYAAPPRTYGVQLSTKF